jgi:LuxR family transcriptional regulator, maltose regulon positive regulatory protein
MTAMISDSSLGAQGEGFGQARSTDAFTSLLDDSVPWAHRVWVAVAFVLGAISRDALDGPDGVRPALEQVLALAEAEQVLFPVLTLPAPGPAALAVQSVLSCEPLTRSEARVLRYLPTNLSTPEIAAELYLSTNTVKTHQRHVYQKLDASSLTEAVERARALGLLPPSSRRP